MFLEKAVNKFCDYITRETKTIAESWFGKMLNYLVLLGPATFLPTIDAALFASNIDALRTPTWGLMTIVNIAAFLSLAREGHWIMRLVGMLWVVMMSIITFVVLIR